MLLVQSELPFRSGDVLTVYGEMDDDGFYYGELAGRRGLVPSNFLQEAGGPPAPGRHSTPGASGDRWADAVGLSLTGDRRAPHTKHDPSYANDRVPRLIVAALPVVT